MPEAWHVQESGRPWKAAGERASSLKNPLLSSSWETKMQAKREHKQFQAARTEALAVHKEKLAVSPLAVPALHL